ncbi:MAG TPA: long-chain N-acyl amino acid synthase [Casimicrobiaceae bacterium]|nr:long-chain N-acyl amino acid synthase [Casimicrobiaceae bacterium]
MRKLIERVRRSNVVRRWPWRVPDAEQRVAFLPTDRTGFTVHRDVALRLRNMSIDLRNALSDQGPETGAFKIRVAGSPQARREATSLVRKRYAARGYLTSATLVNSHSCTFSAYDEGRLAGTVSLRLDSEDGLAADELYRNEMLVLRRQWRRICEFTRLAVDTTQVPYHVLAALFHTVFLFAQKLRGFDYVVIEVNPRHVGYYQRALGFEVIGGRRHNPRVDAPAVLMGVSLADIAGKLERHAGTRKGRAKTRNLYEHGFSKAEAEGILGRLRKLDAV